MSTRNKQIAISFIGQITSGDVREAFHTYVDEEFQHHDPRLREGTQALADAWHADQVLFPARLFAVERALEEGDLVAVHSRVQPAQTEPERAQVHILRFRNGRICELWHVSEQVPDEVINNDGAF